MRRLLLLFLFVYKEKKYLIRVRGLNYSLRRYFFSSKNMILKTLDINMNRVTSRQFKSGVFLPWKLLVLIKSSSLSEAALNLLVPSFVGKNQGALHKLEKPLCKATSKSVSFQYIAFESFSEKNEYGYILVYRYVNTPIYVYLGLCSVV